MRSFPLEIVDGHPLVHFPSGVALIDTGSPATIPAPAIVARILGRPVKRLLGVDRLRRRPVLLDFVTGRYEEDPVIPPGEALDLEPYLGVFRIPFQFQGRAQVGFLDSGAKLSYADPSAVAGLEPVGTERDFYPLFGEFEVRVYELEIELGSRKFRGRFGILPELLQLALSLQGLGGWILGSEYFVGRRTVLDLANHRVIDVTESYAGVSTTHACCGTKPHLTSEKMGRAYDAARRLVDAELAAADRELLSGLGEHDVVVVAGSYDRVEDVLRLANIPHQLVRPEALAAQQLSADQIVIVNCPGKLPQAALDHLRAFVEQGGSLVTTDWALKHVIESAFPGFVAHNGRSTGDEVVRVEVEDSTSPWLSGMFQDGADPLWWLEGASYPIRVLDTERVRVLLTSPELGARHGEAPVAVAFNAGRGEVLHMVSHYYLQRAELRTARHARSWKTYAEEIGAKDVADRSPSFLDDLRLSEVEAAHKSLRFMTNVFLEKQRKKRT